MICFFGDKKVIDELWFLILDDSIVQHGQSWKVVSKKRTEKNGKKENE